MRRFIATLLIFAMCIGSLTMAVPQVAEAAGDVVIVLDPGHDSKHTGAYQNGLKEHELNLKIAQYCYEELSQYRGVKVYMTRTEAGCAAGSGASTEKCLDYRAEFAESKGADALVSFHLNSNSSSSPSGAEVYYPNSNYDANCYNVGKGLATSILDKLGDLGLKERGITTKNSSSRVYPDGSTADYYRVIRECKYRGVPGLIIEHAYMSNINDVNNFLNTEAELKALGVADAKAIAEYYGLQKGFGFKWTNLGASSFTIDKKAKLYYAVNESASITVQMYDGKDRYIKTIVSNKKVGTNDQVVYWDMTDANGNYVPNGTYRFTIIAKNNDGETVKAHKWFSVTGNSPLEFKWTNLGYSSRKVGEKMPLYYAVNKAANITIQMYDGNDKYIKTIVSNKKVGTNDQVAYWDMTDANGNYVSNGTYRFTIIATNEAGETVKSHKWFKVTGNEPLGYKWTNLGYSSRKVGEKMPLYYAVNKPASITIQMYDGNNKYIKTIISNKKVGTNDQVDYWDLTDGKGKYVKDGTYRFTIIATTTSGEKITTHKWFKVSGSVPLKYKQFEMVSNGVEVGDMAELNYSVNKYSNVTVQVFDGKNNFIKTLESKKAVNTEIQTAMWDLTDKNGNYILDGTYRFTIIAESIDGEKITSHKWFTTTGNPPLVFDEVQCAKEEEGVTKVPLYYSVNKDAKITVQLFDGKDNFVRTLESGKVVGTGEQVTYWDLKDGKGNFVEAGNYRFTIIAENELGERVIAHRYFKITNYSIMGTSDITLEQLVAYYNANETYPAFYEDSGAPTIEDFCKIYMEECEIEGVRVEVAFCQAMVETGFLRFIGDVDISQYNFAGIGATGGGEPGHSFTNVREGIRAQVQHLKAYASTEELQQECVDPRFDYVTRYSAPYLEWLGINENPYGVGWATAPNYGIIIKNNYLRKLFTY